LVDRVYKANLPALRTTLENLRKEFARLEPSTNWSRLRIEPLLKHVVALERSLRSREFPRTSSGLRGGVTMLHSDLVYLQSNVDALKRILASERQRLGRTRGRKRAG
jgi:hypothetical protein